MGISRDQIRFSWIPLAIAAALLFVYFSVIVGLVKHWWSDENYSHGLIIPFIVGFIVWQEFDRLKALPHRPEFLIGLIIVVSGLVMLLFGTLGSELLTQRVSLVLLMAGATVYFFGRRILFALAVPFFLFILAIPIPQIVFNKIAFPLQLLASRAASAFLLFVGIPAKRSGNVIELVTIGGSKVALEVVEACSGIRSLMTLVTLGLLYAYFTRDQHEIGNRKYRDIFKDPNFWRTVLLILAMVPIALITNASRVFLTGIGSYYYGQQIVESWWHDGYGWLSFCIALVLLVAVNWALSKIAFPKRMASEILESEHAPFSEFRRRV